MNIGHACKLLDQEMNMFIISELEISAITNEVQVAYKQ